MKLRGFILVLIAFQLIGLASANSYNLEFNQVKDKILVSESVNNVLVNNYSSSNILEINGAKQYFVYRIIFPDSFADAIIRVNLDKGIIIPNKEIFPEAYKIETNGETISILWELKDVKMGNSFPIFVVLEDTTKINYSYLWAIPLVLLGSIIIFWILNNKKKKKINEKNKIKKDNSEEKEKVPEKYSYLLDTEKKVIEELKKADRNELWQKQIQITTGFSKAKVSRLIRNLESRGLIKKIPMGNTNKIKLI